MVGESDQNVLMIQIDAPSFIEFELSEFEMARVDCKLTPTLRIVFQTVALNSGFYF